MSTHFICDYLILTNFKELWNEEGLVWYEEMSPLHDVSNFDYKWLSSNQHSFNLVFSPLEIFLLPPLLLPDIVSPLLSYRTLYCGLFCRKASWFPWAVLSFPQELMEVCIWCLPGVRRVGSTPAPPPMPLAPPKGKCNWPSMVRAPGQECFSWILSGYAQTHIFLPNNVPRRLYPQSALFPKVYSFYQKCIFTDN